jgi:tRNA A-37 threonylcarbamoyl transferase component Bud32
VKKNSPLLLPPHFTSIKNGPLTLWVREEYREKLLGQGIERLEDLISRAEVKRHFDGRSLLTSVEIKGRQGERMVIRSYFHGGWYGKINKDFFWGKFRPLKELMVSEEVSRRGIQTIIILTALSKRVFGPLYKSKLISREIVGALDLIRYLQLLKQRPASERLKVKTGLIKAVAGVVRTMHDRGIYHADLHLKNVLVQETSEGDFAVYLIDFDKSEIRDVITPAERIKNLMRLNRSAEKLKKKGLPITFSDQWRFLREYFHDERQAIEGVKKDVKRYLIWQEFHRLGWKLSSLFSTPLSSVFSLHRSA